MNEHGSITVLETVDSTNSYILRNPDLLSKNFYAVRAINQTKGRGRFSREWDSSSGEDLSLSVVFIPEADISEISVITIYAGLAVFSVLKAVTGDGLYLKWPNDIYFNERKICGILCEMALTADKKPSIVIGVGINVNRLFFPENLSEKSVSIRQIIKKEYSVSLLSENIHAALQESLSDFRGVPVPENILSAWIDKSKINEEITYYNNDKSVRGFIVRINPDGSLLIKNSNSGNGLIYSGEIAYD